MNSKGQQETVNTERFNKTDLLRDSSLYIQLVLANFIGTESKLYTMHSHNHLGSVFLKRNEKG